MSKGGGGGGGGGGLAPPPGSATEALLICGRVHAYGIMKPKMIKTLMQAFINKCN